MLPGPGLRELIIPEGRQTRDQQSRVARRAQAHVDLVERTGRRHRRQQVDDALPQTREEQRVVQRPRAVRLALAGRIMQEDEIQIRAIAQLDATQLAVADDHEAATQAVAGDRLAIAPDGEAMLAGQGLPRHRQHLFQHHLGDEGQIVTDLHQRAGTGDIGGRHVQHLGVAEHPQGLEQRLFIIFGNARQRSAQLIGEARLVGG